MNYIYIKVYNNYLLILTVTAVMQVNDHVTMQHLYSVLFCIIKHRIFWIIKIRIYWKLFSFVPLKIKMNYMDMLLIK